MSASADRVLTATEQWHLLMWMVGHPQALDEDTDWPQRRRREALDGEASRTRRLGRIATTPRATTPRRRRLRRWLLPAIVALALDVAGC